MWEGLNPGEDICRQVEPFFRSACSQEPPRGASVLNNALQEGKTALYVVSVLEVIGVRKERNMFPLSHLEGVLFHKVIEGSGPNRDSSG